MTGSALMSATFNGKSLAELHDLIKQELLAWGERNPTAPPLRVEDAMTEIGLFNPFDRQVIKRTFMATLKEGGSNYETLTVPKRWAKGREKWAENVPTGGREELGFG